MPVYQLIDQLVFPPTDLAEPGGLLAVGGDLSIPRLLLAYSMGIFPWYNDGDPILWWSPDPRCIIEPGGVRISRSLAKVLRRATFEVTFDRAFREVVSSCVRVRTDTGEGTWINPGLMEAFVDLHERGFAHSVECWREGKLVGGLYGLSLGRCFFGESMFHRETDASKVAFVTLSQRLAQMDFELIDGQIANPHLESLGAISISREEFLLRLRRGGVLPAARQAAGAFPS